MNNGIKGKTFGIVVSSDFSTQLSNREGDQAKLFFTDLRSGKGLEFSTKKEAVRMSIGGFNLNGIPDNAVNDLLTLYESSTNILSSAVEKINSGTVGGEGSGINLSSFQELSSNFNRLSSKWDELKLGSFSFSTNFVYISIDNSVENELNRISCKTSGVCVKVSTNPNDAVELGVKLAQYQTTDTGTNRNLDIAVATKETSDDTGNLLDCFVGTSFRTGLYISSKRLEHFIEEVLDKKGLLK